MYEVHCGTEIVKCDNADQAYATAGKFYAQGKKPEIRTVGVKGGDIDQVAKDRKDADDDSQAWIAEQRAIAVGHKISSVIDARRDGGTFRSFITVEDDCTCAVDGDCVSCERQIEELNRQMPAGWVAQFTGDANTDDGSTTLDIEITYAP